MATSKPDTATFTDVEIRLIKSIIMHSTGSIDFNAEAVAQDCNYKSGKTVKDRWSQIKGKYGLAGCGGGAGGGGGSKTATAKAGSTPKKKTGKGGAGGKKTTPAKRTLGVGGGEDNNDGLDGEFEGSPTPVAKKIKKEEGVKTEEGSKKEDDEINE
ncbi:hypothetical protein K431DRAFT_330872 [Polychaeton citri CBS 116435]|uniref:Myb-like DNA-binding domain-containing protein n=1 Tax=Polychaeton citri CBS 116435 TaxID=1314669 RepID=A0A9P4Q4D7_9PEZI|nr:hypothetical protein K431DRAFT_330872 [Polychaeton citri CBS 116435]